MTKYSKDRFTLKHPEKYIGTKTPIYRSSWEWTVMQMCDNNAHIQKWASEAIKIPYRDPLTGRQTVYVPDFFVNFVDKDGKQHAELWEIKPLNQSVLEKTGRSKTNREQYVKNSAKWEAAIHFCKNHNIRFRVINESDIYHMGTPPKKKNSRKK